MALSVMEHVRILAEEIGSRPLGSRANLRAAETIRGWMEAVGLDVELQEFDCPVWDHVDTRLTRVGEVLPAAANDFSPPVEVTGPILPVGTVRELEAAHLSGRIGILYGELMPGSGLGSRKAFYYPENVRQIVTLLEEKRPAALITVHPRADAMTRMIHDWEFGIPSATVDARVGAQFIDDGRPLHLKIESTSAPGQFANIVGRKEKGVRRIVLCAHFDTMMGAPGAVDNASGIAALLGVSQALMAASQVTAVEFVALNGEENSGAGAAEYLRRTDTLDEVIAVVNLDGVGQSAGVNTVAVIEGSREVLQVVDGACNRFPGIARVGPWYESDHSAFVARGVPSIALSSLGVTDINHTPRDTVGWISSDRMGEIVRFVTEIIEQLTRI